MKVRDLIRELEAFDDDAEVHFSYNYDDYWQTTVAPKTNHIEMKSIIYSGYHSMPKLIGEEDDDLVEGATQVVVIS